MAGAEDGERLQAAHAAGAVNDGGALRVERGEGGAGGVGVERAERNVGRGLDGAEGAFPVFADIYELHGGKAGAEFVGGEFVGIGGGRGGRNGAGFAVAVGREFGDGAAGGIGGEAQGARGHRERIPEEEAAGERFAEAGEDFDRFGGLDGADEAGEDAEDAGFGAVGHGAGRGWLGEEAAVGGAAAEIEDAGLAFEALDRAVDEWAVGEHAGVVDEIARGKIVGAVEDDVVRGDEGEGVGAREAGDDGRDGEKRIEREQAAGGGGGFGQAGVGGGVEDLPLEVGDVDGVGVDDGDAADAGGGEVEEGGAAESAGANDEYGAALQRGLRLGAEAGEREVALVTGKFVGGKRHPATVVKRSEMRKSSD